MSRPRKDDPRQHQINVRFSTREFVRIHQHASITGKTVTEFGRSVMLRRPRRRRCEPQLVTLSQSALERWRVLGNTINRLAHDLNANHQLDPRTLAVTLRSLRLLLGRCFAGHFDDTATVAAYRLAPAVRTHLRKVCTNLVQIADRYRLLGLMPPHPLPHLIGQMRAVLNGDRCLHGA